MIATAAGKGPRTRRDGVAFTPVDGSSAEVTISLEMRHGLAAEEADRRLGAANRAGDLGARVVSFYLVEMADSGGHQEFGFHSVEDYASNRLGIRPSTAREYMATGRALLELPMIDAAVCDGRLFWSQARLLARIATPETESAWLNWAARRTIREIETQVRGRDKGQLPTDPARRRIHSAAYRVEGRFSAVQYELWNNARAKLEAERDRPVSDSEMMLEAAMLVLGTQPDGTVPGRSPVNNEHFTVVVESPAAGGTLTLRTADGGVPLDPETARAILAETGHGELAAAIFTGEENRGEPAPVEQRDTPTPPRLRRKVLKRDGFGCRCCGRKKNLTVHHVIWIIYGGRTVEWNLVTLCEGCHALVHDGKLVIRGSIAGGLEFSSGCLGGPVDSRSEPATCSAHVARASDDARASSPERVDFRDLPDEVDAAWWTRHAHRFRWRDREGTLAFAADQGGAGSSGLTSNGGRSPKKKTLPSGKPSVSRAWR